MDVHLDLADDDGLVGQIYTQLHQRISTGLLPEGTLLPSSREFAAQLSVSRATVVAAYERLAAHGLVSSRAGVGTFVSARATPVPAEPAPSPLRPRPIWRTERLGLPAGPVPGAAFNFAPGVPSHARFPFARWRALINDQLRPRAEVGYIDPAGHGGLREGLARHLSVSRGVRLAGAQLVITTGAQQAFDVAARVLLDPGDVVAVEDPGYVPAHRAFLAHGARVVGVPVDREGLVVDRIPSRARLVYVTPSHQFPLGAAMSPSRRAALLEWAARHDAAIVEDDYDSEFRFTGRPMTPLQADDREGRVLYVGSFSKTLMPVLRVGFLGVPETLVDAARRAKAAADYGTSGHIQSALAAFIDGGDFARYVRQVRGTYERRHQLLLQGLHEHFADVVQPIESHVGTHVTALLAEGRPPDTQLVQRALAQGVSLGAVSRWGIEGPGPNGLLFGYGGISSARITEGLVALRRVIPPRPD